MLKHVKFEAGVVDARAIALQPVVKICSLWANMCSWTVPNQSAHRVPLLAKRDKNVWAVGHITAGNLSGASSWLTKCLLNNFPDGAVPAVHHHVVFYIRNITRWTYWLGRCCCLLAKTQTNSLAEDFCCCVHWRTTRVTSAARWLLWWVCTRLPAFMEDGGKTLHNCLINTRSCTAGNSPIGDLELILTMVWYRTPLWMSLSPRSTNDSPRDRILSCWVN